MAKSRAAIQAAYRAHKKQKMGEAAYLQAERKRVKQYYVPIGQLPRHKQKQRREDNLLRVRLHRERKKKESCKAKEKGEQELVQIQGQEFGGQNREEESDDSAISEGESEVSGKMIMKMPYKYPQSRKVQTRKRTSRALSRAHRRIADLEKKLKASKRLTKKISKRCERAVRKIKGASAPPRSDTPRSKVTAQLKQAGFSPRSVPQKFKRQLQFSQAIVDEVRYSSAKLKKQNDKKVLNRIISGKVIKKYRLISLTKKSLGIDRRALARVNSKNVGHIIRGPKQQRTAWVKLQNEVLTFLEREDNSRVMPGKKDACKSGHSEQKTQIRVLNDYLNNLYQKYRSENPDKKYISYSAFKRVRQRNPHIKLVNYTARNTSLCQKHQNLSLMLKALATKSPGLSSKTPDDFAAKYDDVAVEIMLNKLLENEAAQNIDFDVWKRTPTESGQKKTKLFHSVLGKVEFVNSFQQTMREFRDHVVRVKTQCDATHKCKDSLPKDECVVQMDFAENYTCVPLEEVQSGYWNQESVTLHPTVIYYRDTESNTLKHHSYVAVSDDRGHNTSTIKAILDSLVPRVTKLAPDIKRIHYWTDSPTAQYRNKTIFSIVADHHTIFDGIYATWNYFESGHGKGPCDGVGGTVKRLADDAVKRGAVIQNANDFYSWAVQEREKTGIEYFFVSKDQCTRRNDKQEVVCS
ncbi:hypothetical protein HOLleu_00469 [Holothuria leucospilota]|uniref:Uncharacterized protein n=1 Tax=Holothuria leucospilota TaxID=206669 RepID=A0A9Q1CNN3_HOLLE|nr:hypothetical protein HOLleu_00469 [Holothuria leucospilota]